MRRPCEVFRNPRMMILSIHSTHRHANTGPGYSRGGVPPTPYRIRSGKRIYFRFSHSRPSAGVACTRGCRFGSAGTCDPFVLELDTLERRPGLPGRSGVPESLGLAILCARTGGQETCRCKKRKWKIGPLRGLLFFSDSRFGEIRWRGR